MKHISLTTQVFKSFVEDKKSVHKKMWICGY